MGKRVVGGDNFLVSGIGRWSTLDQNGVEKKVAGAQRLTLAVLVAYGPEGVEQDPLAEALFPDKQPKQSKPGARVRVSRLRSILRHGAIPDAGKTEPYRLALPNAEVDIWSLSDLAANDLSITAEDIGWAIAGEPFAGVALPISAEQAYFAAKRAQRQVVERFCRSNSTSISYETSERLLWFASTEVCDEELILVVAEALAASGQRDQAIGGLRSFLDRFESELGYRPDDADALLKRLQRQSTPGPKAKRGRGPTEQSLRSTLFPAELRRFQNRPMFGRQSEMGLLTAGTGGLVTGPRGSGKSHLLANLATAELTAGNEVTYLAPQEDGEIDFGPFLTTFPELLTLIGEETELDGTIVFEFWKAMLDLLEPDGDGRRHLLIDDAQWLDRRSAALVHLLVRSRPNRPLAVTVAGRADDQELEWIRLRERLRSLDEVELAGLDVEALAALIGDAHSHTTEQARQALALEVLSLSGGLPVVARAIVDRVDPDSLTIPDPIDPKPGLDWITADFDGAVRRVGQAAAVLGLGFSQSDLLAICRDDDDLTVLRALDVLVGAGHVHLDGQDGDNNLFVFDHVLTQEAFLPSQPFLSRQLHLAAADNTESIHARARYLARAGRPHDGTVDALRTSAEHHYDRGGWWAAAKQYRLAETIKSDELTDSDRIRFAASLDLSGQDGTGPRQRAFESARHREDWHLALEAALSGLPGAEPPDGDDDRLDLLMQIPPEELDLDSRFRYANQLVRHLSLTGHPDRGRAWANEALALASQPDQLAEAHIGLWTSHHHLSSRPHRFPSSVVDAATGSTKARIYQMQAISAIEDGRVDDAVDLHQRFQTMASELNNPIRIWHAMCFDVLLAFDRGQWQVSAQLAERAHQFGLLHGMQEATTVRAGQLFTLYFTAGREGDLLPLFELYARNMQRSALASASHAIAMAAAEVEGESSDAASDRQREAYDRAIALVTDALNRPRSLSPVVVGMLSQLVADSGSADLILESRKFLLPYAEQSIVVGFGVANMGPMWRYLAPLAESDRERQEWLERAVAAARAQGSPTWLAVSLRLLADATADNRIRGEAREICQGTDIFQLPS